jgi:hypothetical protein
MCRSLGSTVENYGTVYIPVLRVSAATRRHVVRWFGARDTLQAGRQHMAGRYAPEQCFSQDHVLLLHVLF